MDEILDSKFVEKSEAIVTQFGFKDLKTFVKGQALFMLMAKMNKYETEISRFEKKYHMDFTAFENKISNLKDKEDFKEEDDYLNWRFAHEALNSIRKQKQELEHA